MKKIKNAKPLQEQKEKENNELIVPFTYEMQKQCIDECLKEREEYREDAKSLATQPTESVTLFNYMKDYSGGLMQTATIAEIMIDKLNNAEVENNIPSNTLKLMSTDYWVHIYDSAERASRTAEIEIIMQEYSKVSLRFFQRVLPIIRRVFGDLPVDRVNNIRVAISRDMVRQYYDINLDDIYNQILLLEGFDPNLDDCEALFKLIVQCIPFIMLNLDSILVNHIAKVAGAIFDLIYELLITLQCSVNTNTKTDVVIEQLEKELVPELHYLQQELFQMFMNTLPILIVTHTAGKDFTIDQRDKYYY